MSPTATTARELIPLHLLPTGGRARINEILGAADEVQRLREIGLRNGADIEMVQTGCPCIIRLGEQRLCFRSADRVCVLVHPRDGR